MPIEPSAPAPRRRRPILLFLPAAVLALVLVAFSGGWWWAQGRLTAEMDVRAQALRQAGWTIAWRSRTVSGFPFRLKVVLDEVSLSLPGEHPWGLAAPQIEAQAYLAQATHWVFAAPQGLTLARPMGGPLVVGGKDLRASLAGVTASPWRIALAGDALTFATPPGARPFSFTTAQHAEAHLRPVADASGDGDVFVEIDGAQAAHDSLVWSLAQDAPVTLAGTGRLLKLAQARAGGGLDAVGAWARAGGALRLDRLSGLGGRAHVQGGGGLLGIDASGRLEGAVPLSLRQEPIEVGADGRVKPTTPAAAAEAAGRQGGGVAFPIAFKGGRTLLGPADVGPAPMVR